MQFKKKNKNHKCPQLIPSYRSAVDRRRRFVTIPVLRRTVAGLRRSIFAHVATPYRNISSQLQHFLDDHTQ